MQSTATRRVGTARSGTTVKVSGNGGSSPQVAQQVITVMVAERMSLLQHGIESKVNEQSDMRIIDQAYSVAETMEKAEKQRPRRAHSRFEHV